jgi:hypothetical protein
MKKQRIELKDCGVKFIEEEHRYFLGDTELSGITHAISTQLGLANAFDNIPAAILEKATQRGNEIHKSIQRFNNEWFNDDSPQVQSYIRLCKENGIVAEANEYLVSDLKHWASSIDLVARVDDCTFDLYDIKTWATPTNDNLMKATRPKICGSNYHHPKWHSGRGKSKKRAEAVGAHCYATADDGSVWIDVTGRKAVVTTSKTGKHDTYTI